MCKWTLPKRCFTYGYFNPVCQIAIIFLCGGVSTVLASLSEPKWRGCCWDVSDAGGCRRTTIWALDPCCRMFASSSRVKLTADTLFTSTSLQTHTCKNTACQRDSNNILMWCYWTSFSFCLFLQECLNSQRWGLSVMLIDKATSNNSFKNAFVSSWHAAQTDNLCVFSWVEHWHRFCCKSTHMKLRESLQHLWCVMTCLLQETSSQTWVLSTVY